MFGARLLLLAGLLGCSEASESPRVVDPAPVVATEPSTVDVAPAAQTEAKQQASAAETLPWTEDELATFLRDLLAIASSGDAVPNGAAAGEPGGAVAMPAVEIREHDDFPALLSARTVTNFFSILHEHQAEAEPKPDSVDPEPEETGRSNRGLSDHTGSSCRATSRNGPNSEALLALLALASSRTRDAVARLSASA
jgi:hypothetical protein